jgi:transcription elongation factor Elf1
VQVKARRESKPRAAPQKKGYTFLVCGHKVPLANVYITTLGAGLGSMEIYCDRCADFIKPKKTRKKKNDLPAEPLF